MECMNISSLAKLCSKGPARGWRSNVATISSNEPNGAASSPLRAEMNSGAKKVDVYTKSIALDQFLFGRP